MRFLYTEHFQRNYKHSPFFIQKAFAKQLQFLAKNPHHPSLHMKKYDESNGVWQARVNQDWRFYFMRHKDAITLLDILSHPK